MYICTNISEHNLYFRIIHLISTNSSGNIGEGFGKLYTVSWDKTNRPTQFVHQGYVKNVPYFISSTLL